MPDFVQLSLMIGPGVPVPVGQDVIDAVESISVTSATQGASGFQIVFKLPTKSPLHTLFMLGAGVAIPIVRVIIAVKVNGVTQVLMDGVMTDHEVSSGSSPGMSTLTVKGEDLSALMKLVDLTGFPYVGMPAEARVALILAKYAVFGVIPLVVPTIFTEVPLPTEKIPVQNKSDHEYITALAAQIGYVFYVDPGPALGTSTAFWGPEIRVGIPQPALSTNFDAHTDVESLSFRYNPDSASMPTVTIQVMGVSIMIPIPNVSILKPPLGLVPPITMKINRLQGLSGESPAKAMSVGLAEASNKQDVVTGTGTLDVRRYGRVLRARALVGVRGAGDAFNGLHYVSSVTSNIQRGSFTQSFSLVRNGLLSTLPAVPV